MATMPAVSGQLAASTNDVLAVAVICFAYRGYWLAVFAALENYCVKLGLRGVERRAAVGMRGTLATARFMRDRGDHRDLLDPAAG